MPTIREVLKNSTLDLMDTQLILAHLLRCSRAQLYMRDHEVLEGDNYAQWLELSERAAQGFPLAYICGEKECYGLSFKVTSDVLIPRPETEILIEIGLNYLAQHPAARVLDLGTGSGVIACTLAHFFPRAQVIASDISQAALAIAQDNAARLNLSNIIGVHSDGFHFLQGCYDLIISNPPYLAETDPHRAHLRYEPAQALIAGPIGLEYLSRFAQEARLYLSQNGLLCMEHAWDQGEAVAGILMQNGYETVETVRDLSGHQRVTIGRG